MRFDELSVMAGRRFHDEYDKYHACKDDDTPVYFLVDGENWLTICQEDDNDDGLWRGEWWFRSNNDNECDFNDYDGRETPQEVLESLCLQAQFYVAMSLLKEEQK